MCGYIFLKSSSTHLSENCYTTLVDKIKRRGPDQSTMHDLGVVQLFHSRLSIIDLAHGCQPMYGTNEFSHLAIVFNGEIYNYLELKKKLSPFYQFTTFSDTEVLLAAYCIWGDSCLDHINGMFSFVIYDIKAASVFAARDPSGQKPLFYSHQGSDLLVSSCPYPVNGDKIISSEAISSYLYHGFIIGNCSIYQNVYCLPPGHKLFFDHNSLHVVKYDSPTVDLSLRRLSDSSFSDALDLVDNVLNHSVQRCLVSDVPIGLLLSGGIDSSLILHYLKQNMSDSYICFTLDSNDSDSEYSLAHDFCNGENLFRCTPDDFTSNDFLTIYGDIFSQPFSDSSAVYTSCLFKYVSTTHKCVLSGDGGDELFNGYNSRYDHLYSSIPSQSLFVRRFYSQLTSRLSSQLPLSSFYHYGFRYPIFSTKHISSALGRDISEISSHFTFPDYHKSLSPLDNVILDDYLNYLPFNINVKSDEISMYYGVESRSPFQDINLRQVAFSLPNKFKSSFMHSKIILRQLHKGRFHNHSSLPKKGFGVNYSTFLRRQDLCSLLDSFYSCSSKISKYMDCTYIKPLLANNFSAARWNFMALASWLEYNI